jgi:TolB-like protein/Tfp pilus assembly protein PilF
MKLCPECRRDYYDDSLLYCLDDGAALLEGPASGSEPATAILHETPPASEAATRAQIHTTDIPAHSVERTNYRTRFSSRLIGVAAAILVLLVGAFFGYRYFTADTKRINSIAVLPLVNASDNEDIDFLSDGISETLINNFTKVPSLRVTARSTAFRYKGREIDPQTIGHDLNVGAILTGRVLPRGDVLSIQIDLINTDDGSQIWGNQYNGKVSDILDLQQRIARDVSESLKWKLSGIEEQQIARNYTENAEAYQLYLRGRDYWNKRTSDNIRRAIEQFRAAADKDPNYALAYVGLADSYILLEEYTGEPASETVPQAKEFATRALTIDPSLAEAHVSLALVYDHLWQWADADKEFKRAIELNPNYPTAHHWYSVFLRDMGRFDDALNEIKRAEELDPSSLIISVNVGTTFLINGDADAAADQAKKAMDLDPSYAGAYLLLGRILIKQGRYEDGLAALQKAIELSERSTINLRFFGFALGMAGKRSEALAIVQELERRYAQRNALGQDIAAVYTGLGEKNTAFEWLGRDLTARSGTLQFVRSLPEFESLRSDPRYSDLLRSLNLAQ